jgi:PAS domain S-box-containing protein
LTEQPGVKGKTTPERSAPLWLLLCRRLGPAAAGAAALVGLLAYLLVLHSRSAHALRDDLLSQRAQEARLRAAAVAHLLAEASEDLRNLSSSSELSAYFEARDLGMSLRYGLGLSLVPVRERLEDTVAPEEAGEAPALSRLFLFDEEGRLLASTAGQGPGPAEREELLGGADGVHLAREGRELVATRTYVFKGRRAGLLVGWLSPERLREVLGRDGVTSLALLDEAGRPYLPEGGAAGGLAAAGGARLLPADGAVAQLEGGKGGLLAVRVPLAGHGFTLLQLDSAEILGRLSPWEDVLGLGAAAAAVLLGVALAFHSSARSLVLRVRLAEAQRGEAELKEEHRALQREVEARQRLEAAHARLALAVEQAAEAIALTDPAGVFEYVNPAFQRMTGWSPGEVRTAAELDLGERGGEPTLAGALASKAEWRGEVRVRRCDGAVLSLEVMVSPVRCPAGEVVSQVLVARDVTEERRLREQLRHTQRLEAVGTLAGGVAHDFNNLLSVINGYAAMALGALPEDHPVREDLSEILAAGGRAAELTRQLLAFGRRQVLKPEVLDLNAVVAGVEKMLRRLIPEDIELCTEPAAELRRVRVDPGQLEHVLVNLVVNARDAMPSGGRIRIGTANALFFEGDPRLEQGTQPGEYVRLSVADDGNGMDEGTVARCFEPFFTTKPAGKGTGLGLSTVYGIVTQSHGMVRVESRPFQGATFELYFPVAEDGPAAVVARPAPLPAGPARPGEAVLVVEDEPQLRELLRARLSALGYLTLTAADGAEALELAIRQPRIDALLSDVVMPHLSGPELARRVRALFPSMVVVLMSGHTQEAVARQGTIDGGAAVIEKPDGLDSVATVLRGLLDAPGRAKQGP